MKRELVALALLGAVFAAPPIFAQAHGFFGAKKSSLAPVTRLTPPIFMYHEVMDIQPQTDAMRQVIAIRPNHIEEQFKYLEENNYLTLFVSEFVAKLGTQIPEKTVVLTFDDGTSDVYDTVLPLIKKYQMKITVFANPGFDGTNGRMTYAQLRELSESGLVEIGAHTMRHVDLTAIPDDDARMEIQYSKEVLEQIIGKAVTAFAYPFGRFGYREEKMVADAGFRIALAADSSHGKNYKNLLQMPRVTIGEKTSLKSFVRALRGW